MHTIQPSGFLVAYSCHYEMAVHATGACAFVAASYMISGGKIIRAKPWNNDFQKLAKYFSDSGAPKTRFFAKVFFVYMLLSFVFWSWVRLSF